MGIPTFFRSIIQKDRQILCGASKNIPVDYFFIDFNSIIYNSWHRLAKTLDPATTTNARAQRLLIDKVVSETRHMIRDVVVPAQYTYISMDGTAPRAKMVQQRSRRYKSIQMKELVRSAVPSMADFDFDPSPNITPGTVFMQDLSKALQKMIKGGDCGRVYLNDSNTPGEGEHKFLPRVKNMVKTNPDSTVVVMSPDGDMISLSMLTQKKNMLIMRVPDPASDNEKHFVDVYEYIYCDINKVRDHFYRDLISSYNDSNIDEIKILTDYNFLLVMVGNDFVPSMEFLKIRNGGMDILIRIYNDVRQKLRAYLIVYDASVAAPPKINMEFFRELILQITYRENSELRKHQSMIEKEMSGGGGGGGRRSNNDSLNPEQLYRSRVEHIRLCNPDNPLFPLYKAEFQKIDYGKEKHEWKSQYYQYFVTDASNNYNTVRIAMVHNYFESLMFTLYYYLTGCPSWTWHYRYRVSPIPSDMYTILSKHRFDLNSIRFQQDEPFTPFQQLMMILPPQMSGLLPAPLASLMRSSEMETFYPPSFRVDALAGIKYIYSEAHLPDLDSDALLSRIRAIETTLTDADKKRNTNKMRIMVSGPIGSLPASIP
jgi:5'-3' exonuclease